MNVFDGGILQPTNGIIPRLISECTNYQFMIQYTAHVGPQIVSDYVQTYLFTVSKLA